MNLLLDELLDFFYEMFFFPTIVSKMFAESHDLNLFFFPLTFLFLCCQIVCICYEVLVCDQFWDGRDWI